MNASTPPRTTALGQELAAALEWWMDAGVDCVFQDDATAWLKAEKETHLSPPPPAPTKNTATGPLRTEAGQAAPERVDFFASGKPRSLEEFREFWMTTTELHPTGLRGRVAPRGPSHADVMVLVVEPEEGDKDQLLSGPQGVLLGAILRAAQVDPARVYLASALPRHTPLADTHALAAGGLDAVLHHHIALVQPKRLIGFGTGLAAFLGQNGNRPGVNSAQINQAPVIENALLSEGLDTLSDMPRLKARFWRRWIEWSTQ